MLSPKSLGKNKIPAAVQNTRRRKKSIFLAKFVGEETSSFCIKHLKRYVVRTIRSGKQYILGVISPLCHLCYRHTRIEKRGCLNVAWAPPQNDLDHFWVTASYIGSLVCIEGIIIASSDVYALDIFALLALKLTKKTSFLLHSI